MYNAIITIFKKEIARFFGDKRTAFSTILLPGIMIFVMYSFMGDALSNQFSVDEDEKTVCYVRSEERRVWKECGKLCRSRWSQ